MGQGSVTGTALGMTVPSSSISGVRVGVGVIKKPVIQKTYSSATSREIPKKTETDNLVPEERKTEEQNGND